METDIETFRSRRREFQRRMAPDGVALFFAPVAPIKSNDVPYPYRPNSDFYYLTGFSEEEAVLVLWSDRTRIYVRERNPERETWDGPRLGVERAAEALGISEAHSVETFESELSDLLRNRSVLHYEYGLDAKRDALVLPEAHRLLHRGRGGDTGPGRIEQTGLILHEMRLTKGAAERAILEKCADVTDRAHQAAMAVARPGMREYELQATILYEFKRAGGSEGYESIVASGANACVLHYVKNNAVIAGEDLILIDAGVELDGMNADVTRTFPANGRFTTEQRDVYSVVLRAQERAIERSIAGATLQGVHEATVRDLCEGLRDLGVHSASVDEMVEKKLYQAYYMHRTGHWLGADVHDVGSYYQNGSPRVFVDGMVCTVEPGLYFAPHLENVPDHLRGIGVRIEDDVMISGSNPINLTAAIPKSIEAVEAACHADVQALLK